MILPPELRDLMAALQSEIEALRADNAALRQEVDLVAPGFEGASPAEVAGQVLGGDAVEAGQPLFEAAVVSVDVVDVQMRRLWGRLSRRRHGVKGNLGLARKGGQRLSALAA